jgi:hypothetical protein
MSPDTVKSANNPFGVVFYHFDFLETITLLNNRDTIKTNIVPIVPARRVERKELPINEIE